jgi:cobalt-zinc-cadmium efflux system membrane fusion protein
MSEHLEPPTAPDPVPPDPPQADLGEHDAGLSHAHPVEPGGPLTRWVGRILNALILLLVAAGAVVGGAFWLELIPESVREKLGLVEEKSAPEDRPPSALEVQLLDSPPHTLSVPRPVREALGMERAGKPLVADAKRPKKGLPMVLPGSTALDPTRLLRIRARFAPAEVVRIGDVHVNGDSKTAPRELRSGDTVRRGDVLGVFYSTDVGNKKNDLYDAIVQLALDEEVLERATSARGSVAEIFILNAQKAVVSDRNAIARAENTLRAWNINQDDVDAVKREAEQADLERIKANRSKKSQKEKDRESEAKKKQLDRWARVELKAPFEATIIERNVSRHEIVADGTTNLFVLARVDLISVVAYPPEDDLPRLQSLPPSRWRWTLRTAGLAEPLEGAIDEIGYLIDPNQHTGVIKGYVANPDRRLRGGQFVSVTIDLPPPDGLVEIPATALVDDGRECVVFVRADPNRPDYTMRRVLVTHRFDDSVWVRSELTAEQKKISPDEEQQGLLAPEPLRPGETVILSGVLELKKEVEDREASRRLEDRQKEDEKKSGRP